MGEAAHLCDKQDTAEFIFLLEAASDRYDRAKLIHGIRAALTGGVPIVFTTAAVFHPPLRAWAALYGLILLYVDPLLLQPMVRRFKVEGAKCQELFDCELFDIEWNPIKAGRKPTNEELAEWSASYRTRGNPSARLEAWYPKELRPLPHQAARIACQRFGTHWDYRLRFRYSFWLLLFVVGASILILAFGLIQDWSLATFVLVGLALSPPLRWTVDEHQGQRRAGHARRELRDHIVSTWQTEVKDSGGSAGGASVRRIQDEIFERRRSDPEIFNWVYERFREQDEDNMRDAAHRLVVEWERANSP